MCSALFEFFNILMLNVVFVSFSILAKYRNGSVRLIIGKTCLLMLLRNTVLKGMCPEIFYLYFFPDPSLSGPLTNRLEYFLHSFLFYWDFFILKKLCGVPPMEESISVVCITPLSQSPWCPLHRFRSISAVCSHCYVNLRITPQSQALQRRARIKIWLVSGCF